MHGGSPISLSRRRRMLSALLPFVASGALAIYGCTGDDGDAGPPGPAGSGSTRDDLRPEENAPGVIPSIVAVSGGSGPGGTFRSGDLMSVTFTLRKSDGSDWELSEMDRARMLVSGPTFNYQRVLEAEDDVAERSVSNLDGSYTYTFASRLPSAYAPPFNDTDAFGAEAGELAGQPLLSGTYTLGATFYWRYSVEGESYRDTGNVTYDFLFGGATTVERREVVGQANCNQCHQSLRAHGETYREVSMCMLCHTSGAEDGNADAVAGGTPGTSIDFRVMIHRIHNGKHLPSVLGVGTNPDGTRNYAAGPRPYLIADDESAEDFSKVGFPVMPSAYVSYLFDKSGTVYLGTGGNGPMPRDIGYAGLSLRSKQLEDTIRSGVVSCDKCHGDPDGAGASQAPAQGHLYSTQPSIKSCGSCHDDVDWGSPYVANGQTMPAQANDSTCALCHVPSGGGLAVVDAHRHPYSNPGINTGVNLAVTAVSGGTGTGGNHQPGDPIGVTFSAADDAGRDLLIHRLARFQIIVTGPTTNPQWVLPNVTAFDETFRKSSPFTGTGTITKPTFAPEALKQTIAVAFTSATTFDVLGSASAPLTDQSIGSSSGSSAAVSYAGLSFTVTQASTAFAAGDRWYFEAVPIAPSYSVNVARDIALELLGYSTGLEQVPSAANAPMYWGRQSVFERTALPGSPAPLSDAALVMGRYVAADPSLLGNVAVSDRVVLDAGTPVEEYLTVGRIQSIDDFTGEDLGTRARYWFSTPLRYDHAQGATIQEATLSGRREGVDYTMDKNGATSISLLPGRFMAGNPVVVSYRTDGRFGWHPGPGAPLQPLYPPPAADTDDIGLSWGDWKALPLLDGTYTVGMWVNQDFTVMPLGMQTTTGAWNDLNTDNTTYRMISPPASKAFLFGDETRLVTRDVISSGANCDSCHGDLQAHGNGRRGLETCLLCHATSGLEDGAPYSFDGWYTPPTPGVTMDFRTLLHKVHMGKALSDAPGYVVDGVFLGTPYPVTYEDAGFPAMPGEAKDCAACHGQENAAWLEPGRRRHPDAAETPTREWRAVCSSCHDSSASIAHVDAQTDRSGEEACAICHGEGEKWAVETIHKTRR